MHQNESKIDILINNAGVLGTPYRLTGDGFEYQMQTNYFGPFLMTNLLLGILNLNLFIVSSWLIFPRLKISC